MDRSAQRPRTARPCTASHPAHAPYSPQSPPRCPTADLGSVGTVPGMLQPEVDATAPGSTVSSRVPLYVVQRGASDGRRATPSAGRPSTAWHSTSRPASGGTASLRRPLHRAQTLSSAVRLAGHASLWGCC